MEAPQPNTRALAIREKKFMFAFNGQKNDLVRIHVCQLKISEQHSVHRSQKCLVWPNLFQKAQSVLN